MVVCACAGVQVVIDTGDLELQLETWLIKFKNKRGYTDTGYIVYIGNTRIRSECVSMAGLVPVMILLARACGYDAMTGIALILLGAGGSYSVGPFSANITGTAQTLAGLQVFSGPVQNFLQLYNGHCFSILHLKICQECKSQSRKEHSI